MQSLKKVPYFVAAALLLYMPLHVFLSQWLSLATGGLAAWKVGKDVVLSLAVLFTICLVWWQGKGSKRFNWLVIFTFCYGVLHLLLWALNSTIYRPSAELGILYNMRLPLCAILGYGAVLLYPKLKLNAVLKLVIGVSTVVAALGVIQYFLPSNILTHFGYSLQRGVMPAFYVNGNPNLPVRIMSTIRDPNSLGAYLVLPAVLLGVAAVRTSSAKKRAFLLLCLLVNVTAIALTLSRSAWLGLVVAILFAAWLQYTRLLSGLFRRYWLLLVVVVLAIGVTGFLVRNTSTFQSYVAHGGASTQKNNPESDGYHVIFIKRGLEGIKAKPLGHGPGTAGLASIQNPKGSFLTENYYLQIGYEIGLLGLALFISLSVWVYVRLLKAQHEPLTIALLSSFWAYVIANMVLQSWSNEAVAAQWWILAGIVVARSELHAKK